MMPQTMHILALAGALCSAAATIFIRQGLRGSEPYAGFWINLVVGTIGLWAAVIFTGLGHVSTRGALFFVLAGLIGTVAVLRKLGLSGTGAVVGSAINVTTALVAFTAFLLASGRPEVMVCRGRSLAHFTAAGLLENAGVFMNVVALSLGTVSIVAPLYGTAPIFVLFLAPFFLRDVETLSGRVILGTLLIVLGVYLITALSGR